MSAQIYKVGHGILTWPCISLGAKLVGERQAAKAGVRVVTRQNLSALVGHSPEMLVYPQSLQLHSSAGALRVIILWCADRERCIICYVTPIHAVWTVGTDRLVPTGVRCLPTVIKQGRKTRALLSTNHPHT